MSLFHRSCSLLTGLALLCSQTVGVAQQSSEPKEKGGALGSKTPKVVPAHPTGFSDIAPYLSADGAMLSFYDTREMVAGADALVSFISKTLLAQVETDESAKVTAKFLTLFYEQSGVKSLAAMGSSSVPRGNQLYYNRKYVARSDKKPGFIWNVLTEKTARLSGLDLLPTNTAAAWFGNLDIAYLDSLITKVSADAGSADDVKQWKQGMEKSGLKWEEILASLDGEVGVVLLMDQNKTIRVPKPMALELPHPSGGILLRVKSDYLYKRISALIGANAPKEEEVDGVRILSQAVPNPVVPDFAPTVAIVDQYLMIGTSRDFPLQLAATLRGKTPGLLKSEEFKLLSQDVPLEGSAFSFASKRFCDSIDQLFTQALAAVPNNAQPEMMKQMSKVFFGGILPEPSFTAYQRNGADWLMTSNGPQSSLMEPAINVGTISMLGAIAVPNFIRSRSRAQATRVLEDARLLDAAVDQYAIENNLRSGAKVTFKDVVPYLKKDSQLALSGGKDIFGRPFVIKPLDEGIRIHPETVKQVESVTTPEFFKPYAD